MPSYTAVLLPNADGSYRALLPAIPAVTGEGSTRAAALEDITRNAEEALSTIIGEGGAPPREEWPPVRTVWVKNPRRGDASPYIVMVHRVEDAEFRATAVAFTDVSCVSADLEEAVAQVGPLLFQRLTELFARGEHFSTQDDPQNYVIKVTAREAAADAGRADS